MNNEDKNTPEQNDENIPDESAEDTTHSQSKYSETFQLYYKNFIVENIREDFETRSLIADIYMPVSTFPEPLKIASDVNLGLIAYFINSQFSIIALQSLIEEVISFSVTRNEKELDNRLRNIQTIFADIQNNIHSYQKLIESYVDLRVKFSPLNK